MVRDRYIKAENEEFKSDRSNITANALFNFMRNYEYLEKVISDMAICPSFYTEYISYLIIMIDSTPLKEWYIPMTCFCDIPLHQIHYHAEGDSSDDNNGYGKFSIAFHKKYGIKMGIQPIHYLVENSVIVKEISKSLHTILNATEEVMERDEDYTKEFLIEYIRLIKPYYGVMKKKVNQNSFVDIRKNFHDEHEWRYIPDISLEELPLMLIDNEDIFEENLNNTYTDSIPYTKKGVLKFDVDDVRYIFVDSIENRNKLIAFIRGKKRGRRLSRKEKDILISKIMIYDELKEDC